MAPHTLGTSIVTILAVAGTTFAAGDRQPPLDDAGQPGAGPDPVAEEGQLPDLGNPNDNDTPLVDPAELQIPHNPYTILIRFNENARETNPAAVAALIDAIGQTDHTYRMLPGLASLSLGEDLDVAQALQIARSNPALIEYAEPDYLRFTAAVPNDTFYESRMWHLNNTGQNIGDQTGIPGADINAEAAWGIHTGDPDFVVGVIDGGTDPNHADLAPNFWVNPDEVPGNGIDDDDNGYIDDINGWDFFSNDNNPANDAAHGTHVSGTIAAQANNNLGITGVMWEAQIMALRFIGPQGGSTSDAIAAIDYAFDKNVRLTNNSWGGGGFSQGLKDAIDQLQTIDSLFVAAAGNNGSSQALYPARYTSPNIISVAASDNRDQRAGFSNVSTASVDLAAPGVDVYSSVPLNNYDDFDGTSMASPHVAGVVGLVTSFAPELGWEQIRDIVLNSVRPSANWTNLVATGGIVDAEAALLATDAPPAAFLVNLPETLLPGQTTDITIQVGPGTQGFLADSVELQYSINGGQPVSVDTVPAGPDTFNATVPPFTCTDAVSLFPTVDSAETGETAAADPTPVPVGELVVDAQDSFNNDNGWTVSSSSGLTAGEWERGQPVGFNRGNPTSDADGSGWAFLTDNNPNDDNSDVDNGTTTVTSPVYDVSGGATLTFNYWFNDIANGAASPEDVFTVETSTDGGSTWSEALVETIPAGIWREAEIAVDPTSSFQVRFTVGDLGEQNVIEAGLDNIVIAGLICEDTGTPCSADVNGSNTVDAADLLIVLDNFGQTGASGDTDGDGSVSASDLLNLLDQFGDDCN